MSSPPCHSESSSSSSAVTSGDPIVVIGRGILGALTAFRLAHAGRKVVVVGGVPKTTNLAFGWIGGHRPDSTQYHVLNRISRQAWEWLLDAHLGREGYLAGGCLKYAADESADGLGRLMKDAELQQSRGVASHSLSPEVVAELVPGLRGVHAARLQPDDAVLDSAWAAKRALQCAIEAGCEVVTGSVTGFERQGDGSISHVQLSDGTQLRCSQVVLAAAKGTSELAEMIGFHLPIKGIWGIQLRTRPLQRRLMPKVAMVKRYAVDCGSSAGISLGQFPDNSFVINEKFVEGQDVEVRLKQWQDLFAESWPELRDAEISQMTKTARWIPEDGNPVCGFAPGNNSNVYVLLTNSDGVTMSALLSEVASAELCGGKTGLFDQCRPGRFGVAPASNL